MLEHRVKLVSISTVVAFALIIASIASVLAPTRVDAIADTQDDSQSSTTVSTDDEVRVADDVISIDPVVAACGDSNGSLFTTVTVGSHTVGPIKIVIAGTSPTYVDSVVSGAVNTVPYKMLVYGASTGGTNNDGIAEYLKLGDLDYYAPAPDLQRTPADVSQVIVCYRTTLDTQVDNDPDVVTNSGSEDDDEPEVLGATDNNDQGNVLGANDVLANTGSPATFFIAIGVTLIALSLGMAKLTKPASVE